MLENVQNKIEGKTKRKRHIDKSRVFFMACVLTIPIINWFVFYLYVNFSSILMAFQRVDVSGAKERVYFTLENFKMIWTEFFVNKGNDTLATNLLNTLLFYLSGTLIVFPVSLLMSYFIYKKILGYRVFRFIAYLPQVMTSSALVIIFRYCLIDGGPYNTLCNFFGIEYVYPLDKSPNAIICLLVYNVMFGFGGNLIIFGGAFTSVSPDVLEAAELDGCTWFQELVKVIIPMIWPTISTALILGLAGILGSSGPVLPFTQGKYGTSTLAFRIYDLVANVSQRGRDLNLASAIGITMTIMMFPIVMLVRFLLYGRKSEDEKI